MLFCVLLQDNLLNTTLCLVSILVEFDENESTFLVTRLESIDIMKYCFPINVCSLLIIVCMETYIEYWFNSTLTRYFIPNLYPPADERLVAESSFRPHQRHLQGPETRKVSPDAIVSL